MKNEILLFTACRLPTCDTLTWLRHLLLTLFWGTGLLIAFRWRDFTAESIGVTPFVFLALLVAGTILLLDFIEGGRWKMLLAVGPGIFITVFLVLPSWHFTGIFVYSLIFISTILFLGRKYRYANQPSVTSPFAMKSENDLEVLGHLSAAEWDGHVQMRLLRRKESNGTALLEAWVRADFQQDEWVANVHVPFCPSFSGQPKWEACQFEGDEVEIRVPQVNPLGARIDLKRPSRRKSQESVGIYFAVRNC